MTHSLIDYPTDMLPKLDPEIKERWLTALRSGDYPKATGSLRNSDGYCCLGVLCDIVKDDVGGGWDGTRFLTGTSSSHAMPPPSVYEHVVEDYDEREHYDGRFEALSYRNDGSTFEGRRPYSFKKIADIIENRC